MSDSTAAKPESLETAMADLEKIVEAMEAGDLPLESLISQYERGVELSKFCQTKLDDAEKRIKLIEVDAAGKAALKPFDSDVEA